MFSEKSAIGFLGVISMVAMSGVVHAAEGGASVRGIEPQSPIVLIYEKTPRAEIELFNPTEAAVLLSTSVHEIDVEQMQSPVVHVLQPVLRMEAHSRARVRFQLELPNGSTALRTQHLKRVWFEGIPSSNRKEDLAFNIRYDLPLLIHPKALDWEAEPWRHLQWCREGDALVARNDSPYVIRISGEVELLPSGKRVRVFPSNVLLPESRLRVTLTEQQLKEGGGIEKVRSFPATAWGFKVPESWSVDVSASCASTAAEAAPNVEPQTFREVL